MEAELLSELNEAERKAIDSLARYKFMMFGYWAGVWVHLNRITGAKRSNPFRLLVHQARAIRLTLAAPDAEKRSAAETES